MGGLEGAIASRRKAKSSAFRVFQQLKYPATGIIALLARRSPPLKIPGALLRYEGMRSTMGHLWQR